MARRLHPYGPDATANAGEKESYVDIATFVMGAIAGISAGVLIVGFLALGAYNRGYSDAIFRRKDWRAELTVRQTVASRALQPAVRRAS